MDGSEYTIFSRFLPETVWAREVEAVGDLYVTPGLAWHTKDLEEVFLALRDKPVAVLGGHLLIEENGRYMYSIMGEGWCCDPKPGEEPLVYADRSLDVALAYLRSLNGTQIKEDDVYEITLDLVV